MDGWNNIFNDKKYDTKTYNSAGEAAYLGGSGFAGGTFIDFMKYTGVYYPTKYSIKGSILGNDEENHAYYFSSKNITDMKNKSKNPVVKVKEAKAFSNISKEYNNGKVVAYKNGNINLNNNEITEFRNTVKSQIKNKGGVVTSINIHDDYYNKNTCALYINNNSIVTNHNVTIVGWDDNYSKNNFKSGKQPNKNGAWIALNSWGNEFGKNGLFYISYDDANVEKYLFGVTNASLASEKPIVNVKYEKNNNNSEVTVTITSYDKINNIQIWKDSKWQNVSGWNKKYVTTEFAKYGTAYTKKTILTKTYKKNTTEYIRVQDELGNYEDGYTTVAVSGIDETAPQITKITATDGNKTVTNTYSNNKLSGSNNIGNTWFKDNVTVKFEAKDNTGIKSYWINGTKCQSKIISATTNGVKLTVYDYADNETYVKVDIKIDKTSPTIKTPKQIVSSDKQSVNLTVPAEDSQSGISQYSFDGGKTWQKGNQYKYTSNQTINAGTIKVKDVAGNIGTYNTKVTISGIDKTIPQITKVIATDGSKTVTNVYSNNKLSGSNNIGNTWFKNNVTLKFEATDNNGIKSYWISGTKGQSKIISSTTNGVKLTVYDYADNEAYVTVNIKIDKDAPKIVGNITKSSNVKYVKSVIITIPKIEDVGKAGLRGDKKSYSYDSGKTWVASNSTTYTTNGNKPIWIRDSVDNILKTTVNIDNVDSEVPKITSVTGYTNNKWVNSDVTIVVNASDDKALAEAAYSFDGGATWQKGNKKVFSKTTNGIVIVVRDKAGWQTKYNNGEKINLYVDKIKPTLQLNTYEEKGINKWVNPQVEASKNRSCYIALNPSDGQVGSGIKMQYKYRINGGQWQTGYTKNSNNELVYCFKQNGKYEFKVEDNAGNESSIYQINITKVDEDCPTISVSGEKGKLTIKAEDAGSGLSKYTIDGKTWLSWPSGKTEVQINKENTTIKAGTIKVKDEAENETSWNRQINTGVSNETPIPKDKFIINITSEPSEMTNKPVKVTVKVNRNVNLSDETKKLGWKLLGDGKTLEKTFNNNDSEQITLIDAEDKNYKEDVYINVDNIDKSKPQVYVSYEKIDNNKVKVTMSSNKELKNIENWELSESKLELSRIYESDMEETIKVQDTLENETDVTIKVSISENEKEDEKGIVKNIKYSQTDYTDKPVTVTITLNRAIKEVKDWILSNDGKQLTRTFNNNYNNTIMLIDSEYEDYTTDVQININNIILKGDINENEKIDIVDLLLLKRHLVAGNNESWLLKEKEFKSGDMNNDEKINLIDLLLLKRKLLIK